MAINIAIIGAGFSGLAVAWYLLEQIPTHSKALIHIFDEKEIGQGTSGIAAGLLHPFVGAHAKLNVRGLEGMLATEELLQIAEKEVGRPVTAEKRGILRLAMTDMQKADFASSAHRYPEHVEWFSAESCQNLAPGCAFAPGLWIKNGMTVFCSAYLQGLFLACIKRGMKYEKRKIEALSEMKEFDLVIVAGGAASVRLPELSSLQVGAVKGQILELSWPEGVKPPLCPLNSHAYLIMSEGGASCLLGATYEKNYEQEGVHMAAATGDILPKGYALFPPLTKAVVTGCRAGLRAVTKDHLPLIHQISSSQWLLTGMGSKGLLYHALYAKELVQRIGL